MPAPAAGDTVAGVLFLDSLFRGLWQVPRGHCEERPRVVEGFRTVTPENFALGTVQTSKGVPHETIDNRSAAGTLRPAVAGRYPALKKGWPRITATDTGPKSL